MRRRPWPIRRMLDSRIGPLRRLFLALGAAAMAFSAANATTPAVGADEAAASSQSGRARHAMVAAANPLATQVGVAILRKGGSAVDAAVAIQAVLGLVEPQSSGLGGGAFMLYYDAKTRKVTAYDGRETAPMGAAARLFLDEEGKPLPFFDAVLGGISTGVPGAVAMLDLAHHHHGRLSWAELLKPAGKLAKEGFIVSPRLAGMIASKQAPQSSAPDAKRYFTRPDGMSYAAGDRLRNPAYAMTLDRIARYGASGLLTGPVAQAIVERLPVPRADEAGPAFDELAEAAAHLEHGDDVDVMIRLNAIVASLYQLITPELQHILDSFPLVEPGLRAGVLEAFTRR